MILDWLAHLGREAALQDALRRQALASVGALGLRPPEVATNGPEMRADAGPSVIGLGQSLPVGSAPAASEFGSGAMAMLGSGGDPQRSEPRAHGYPLGGGPDPQPPLTPAAVRPGALGASASGFDAVAPDPSRHPFAGTSLGLTPSASALGAGLARSPLGGLPLGADYIGDGSGGYVQPTLMAARRDPREASQKPAWPGVALRRRRPGEIRKRKPPSRGQGRAGRSGSAAKPAMQPRAGRTSQGASVRPYPKQYSEADVEALTKMIYVEARGEGEEGKAAVAHVALNRFKTGHRGKKTLRDVIYDEKQFTGIKNTVLPKDYQSLRAVALAVLNGQVADPTAGSRHYYAPEAMDPKNPVPGWAEGRKPVRTIGGHLFFKGVP